MKKILVTGLFLISLSLWAEDLDWKGFDDWQSVDDAEAAKEAKEAWEESISAKLVGKWAVHFAAAIDGKDIDIDVEIASEPGMFPDPAYIVLNADGTGSFQWDIEDQPRPLVWDLVWLIPNSVAIGIGSPDLAIRYTTAGWNDAENVHIFWIDDDTFLAFSKDNDRWVYVEVWIRE